MNALLPHASAAVIASAGTGKTWMLTARIQRLLLAGAEPEGILALTFTRKAAAEMRQRVVADLQALATGSDAAVAGQLAGIGAEVDAASIARARGLFEAYCFAATPLKALTLHSFCAELLGRFALEAGVPAGFALAEDESELRSSAIEKTLEKLHRHADSAESKALDALLALGCNERQVLQILEGFFEQRAAYWAASATGSDPVAALSAALADALQIEPGASPTAATDAPAFSAKLKMLYGLLRDTGGLTSIKAESLEAALETSGNPRLDALMAGLLKDDGQPYSNRGGKGMTPEQKDTVLKLLEEVTSATLSARDTRLKHRTLARSRAALTLGHALLAEFALLQTRAKLLCFPELEWHCCQLLTAAEGAEWVRYKLDAGIEHLLLDEFQDTNPTQWRLLLPLLEEFRTDPERRRTAFLVGDAKQSIYGFRGANAALLGEASDWLRENLGASISKLNTSRRSAPAIMHFVNALFGNEEGAAMGFEPHAAHESLSGIYGAVEVAPLLKPAADAARKPRAANAVPDSLRNPLTEPLKDSEVSLAEREGQWIAQRIAQLLADQTPVTEAGGSRPMRHGDVMVLARNRTHLWAVEAAFAAAGIPFSTATRGSLLDTPLAADLLALLRFLDAPHRNLDLAQALRSPLFSASDEDLRLLARAARAASCNWLAALQNLPKPRPELERARTLLTAWQALAATLPPHDLLDHIASSGDLLARYGAATPCNTRLAGNLSALLQLALESGQGRYPGISRFLAHCQRLAASKGPDEAAPASTASRVRILTVHSAKGLEAPAVFMVNSAPKAQAARGGWRVDWPSQADAPRLIVHVGSKAEQDALSQQLLAAEKLREADEDAHLLYVAATRARQYLFVSGFEASAGSSASSWHARCRAAIARLMPEAPSDETSVWACDFGSPPVLVGTSGTLAMTPAIDHGLTQALPGQGSKPPDRRAADPAAVLRGQLIHALLQVLASSHNGGPAVTDISALRIEAFSRQLGSPVSDALFSQALQIARQVLAAAELQRFFQPGQKAWNEVVLHLRREKQGAVERQVIDRLVDAGHCLWVIDYKTRPSGDAKALALAAAPQLQRYVMAVKRLFPGREVRAAVIATETATWAECLPDQAAI